MTLLTDEKTISYDDVCLVPTYSDLDSRSEADISAGKYSNPMVSAPMIHTSGKNMLRCLRSNDMCATVHRYFKNATDQLDHVKDAIGNNYKSIFFAVGRDRFWINQLHNNGVNKYCVDMAHGDSKICAETVAHIRKENPFATIMAGNVTTFAGYQRLMEAGADMIRVGISGGSACSTAKATAFGVPMITAIMECAKAKKSVGGILIADGGIRSASDILKAIAAGADMAMCGKILASTSEAEGPFYNSSDELLVRIGNSGWKVSHQIKGNKEKSVNTEMRLFPYYAEYAGMASHEMRMRNSSHVADEYTSIEGVFGKIKYSGETDKVIKAINANLRAGMSYCGSRDWKEFRNNAIMRIMSTAGILEKETHLDITMK